MPTRNKRGGFKSFVRRRDGKPPIPEADHHELSEVKDINLHSLLRVLQGDFTGLVSAFIWNTAPQGDLYWNERDLGREPLSPEDYQWLQELYDYHANKQET